VNGIAGIVHRDGRPVAVNAIASMSATLAHRGRDGTGVVCEGPVAMAHRLNAGTLDAASDRQPVPCRPSGSWLVADARIDNRLELRRALGASGAPLCSDGEIVAAAYEMWGPRCVDRIVGDFAFARWDSESRELFCARDAMGVKPFYYFESADTFAFASEARALLTLREVSPELDPVQIAMFVDGIVADRCRTHYKAIQRLPAAHTMTVRRGGTARASYWHADSVGEMRLSSDREYADAFASIFREAVECRMRGAHPVGAALSGGLDSSSIVCTARQLRRANGGPPINTFSLVFPELPATALAMIDERRYIDSVVAGGDLAPRFVRGDRLSPTGDVDEILDCLDGPFAAPNLYLHWSMYRAARDAGVGVFLDGFDGDSAVSHGFARLNGLLQRGEWETFETEVRALATRRRVAPASILSHFGFPQLDELARGGRWIEWTQTARQLTRRFDLPWRSTFVDFALRPATPAFVRNVHRALRGIKEPTESLLTPEMRGVLRESEYSRAAASADVTRSEREMHAEGISQPAYQSTLELADQCATAFGVEPRYPFFDRRLIEFCLSLPDSQKLAGGWPRSVFRRAMEGTLPPEIQWRSDKGNLSPNFHRALRAAPVTRTDVADDSPLAAYVDMNGLRQMRARYCAEPTTLGRSAEGHALFRVLVLERWLSRKEQRGATDGRERDTPAAA
jgi:asparagine synthase (glutamine-hydrolysing)